MCDLLVLPSYVELYELWNVYSLCRDSNKYQHLVWNDMNYDRCENGDVVPTSTINWCGRCMDDDVTYQNYHLVWNVMDDVTYQHYHMVWKVYG